MKRFILFSTLFFFSFLCSQEKINYDVPEGVYKTLESFKNKTPDIVKDLFKKSVYKKSEGEPYYFSFEDSGDRLTRSLFIKDEGKLYLNARALRKYLNKKDKGQDIMIPASSYIEIQQTGNYLYFTSKFQSAWGAGLRANLGAVGGALSATAGNDKVVIYNYQKEEFDIIRNCKDFNRFLDENNFTKYKVNCEESSIDSFSVLSTFTSIEIDQ